MALVTKTKKGGPYSKKERLENSDKVLKLYFEYGYPAVKIAVMTKLNRNTVNSYIKNDISEFSKQWDQKNSSWTMRQVQRLDRQRLRLVIELNKCESFKEKLAIEKLIVSIDTKIANIMLKSERNDDLIWKKTMETLNRVAEENNWGSRMLRKDDIQVIDDWRHELITDLLNGIRLGDLNKKIESWFEARRKNSS